MACFFLQQQLKLRRHAPLSTWDFRSWPPSLPLKCPYLPRSLTVCPWKVIIARWTFLWSPSYFRGPERLKLQECTAWKINGWFTCKSAMKRKEYDLNQTSKRIVFQPLIFRSVGDDTAHLHLIYLHEWLIFFNGFHVGEYTSPMNPMSIKNWMGPSQRTPMSLEILDAV